MQSLILATQRQVVKLLEQEKELIDEVLNDANLTRHHQDENPHSRAETFKKQIELIEGEISKVKSLQVVIAVVGTMKAGKSTTINALVGTEILPSRNQPMTTLPTLITHTKGVAEPNLIFKNNTPLKNLIDSLATSLKKIKDEQLAGNEFCKTEEGKKIVAQIKNGVKLEDKYLGRDAVYKFLIFLNDLVRLGHGVNQILKPNTIDIAAFLGGYADVKNFPEIQVEFSALKELAQTEAKFSLLDTPGPNEAGQSERLQKVLDEQLNKASAVLQVLDYTQLKSDADKKVRDSVLALSQSLKNNNLFFVVNKFDQHNANAMGEQEVKEYVQSFIAEKSIETEHIYPLSSYSAYLANAALHYLKQNKPLDMQIGWQKDFAVKAFGTRTTPKNLADNALCIEAANDLFDNSKFAALLEGAITQSYQNSAILSIQSAIHKLPFSGGEIQRELDDFFSIRLDSFHRDAQSLRDVVVGLAADIEAIAEIEKEIDDLFEEFRNKSSKADGELQQVAKKNSQQYMKGQDEYAKQKRQKEMKRVQSEQQKREQGSGWVDKIENVLTKKRRFRDFFNFMQEENTTDINPTETMCTLYSNVDSYPCANQEQCNNYLVSYQSELEKIASDSLTGASKEYAEYVLSVKEQYEQIVDEKVKPCLENAHKKLKQENFVLNLIAFNHDGKLLISNSPFNKSQSADAIQHDKESISYRVKQPGFLAGVRRLADVFGADWGYDKTNHTIEHFSLDLKQLRQKATDYIDAECKSWAEDCKKDIEKFVIPTLNCSFDVLKKQLLDYRSDFLEAIEDKKVSKEDQKKLHETLSRIQKEFDILKQKTIDLNRGVEPMFAQS